MARKIGVLDIHQNHSATPQTFIKRSLAEILVRRLFAEWVIKNVLLRRLEIKPAQAMPERAAHTVAVPYIPEQMPPREIAGCKFQEPQTLSWQQQIAVSPYRFRRIQHA